MNKILRRGMTVLTTLSLAASLAVPALGAELSVTSLKVHEGINLYVNCESYRASDVTGQEVIPFLYQGTTYIPLRAMASMLGASLEWDQSNKTIQISSLYTASPVNETIGREDTQLVATELTAYEGVEIYLSGQRFVPKDVNGNEVGIYLVNGTTYVPLRAISELFHVNISYDSETARVYIGIQPGQIEAEGDQNLKYPYLSKERNESLQRYKDCIELMEPVVGLMWARQAEYQALNATATAYTDQIRQVVMQGGSTASAGAAALQTLVNVQSQISELNVYLNMMAVRFTDCKAYIENVPFDAREEDLNDSLLFEACGKMLDTCFQEQGRIAQIGSIDYLNELTQNLNLAYMNACSILGLT